MYISIPKEFFVPVLFSEDFRLDSDNNIMYYDSKKNNEEYTNISNRKKLLDLESLGNRGDNKPIVIEEVLSEKDKLIQDQILDYVKGFMIFINQLKSANCLGKDKEAASIELINYYANEIKNIYNEYKNLINSIKMPLSQSDIEGIVHEYINKIEDIYNENLERLNCKNLNYDAIEAILADIINDAKKILREQIIDINCKINNEESHCKNYNDIESKFESNEDIFSELDNEFINEINK